jgi:hypothetical protein
MSTIQTAELRGQTSFDYLTQLLRHETAIAASSADWLPLNYRETIARTVELSETPRSPALRHRGRQL